MHQRERIWSRSAWKWVAGLLLATLLLQPGVQSAFAHAVPVDSVPRPNEILETAPAEISIRFNEPVAPELSQIRVLTQAGQEIQAGPVQPVAADNLALVVSLPPLDNGAHLVS